MPPKRIITYEGAFDLSGVNYNTKRKKARCPPQFVYLPGQKPSTSLSSQPSSSQQPIEFNIDEPYRNPGMIVMDQLTSVFSTSEELKPEFKPDVPSPSFTIEISDTEEHEDVAGSTEPMERFTTSKKLEIKQLIAQHQCVSQPCKDPQMIQIKSIKDDTHLAYQCALCLALFSPLTKSHLRKHLRKCKSKMTKHQQQLQHHLFNVKEKKQLNLYLAELAAIDGKHASIIETESFKKFVNYIGNLCFVVGRSATKFIIMPEFLPSNDEVKGTLAEEAGGLVIQFQAFLKRTPDLHITIVLDFTSLRCNNLGIAIQFLYEWELRTVILSVHGHNEVTSNNIKTIISNLKHKFGINFDSQFIVADEASTIATAAYDSTEYTVCACQSLNTVVKRTTDPFKKSKRNSVEIELDENLLAQVATVQKAIDDLKNVLTADVIAMLDIKLDESTRRMSTFNLIQAWLYLNENDLNRLMEYYGTNEEKTGIVQNLLNSQQQFESYITVFSPFYNKLKLLDDFSVPTINHVLITYYELEDHLRKFINTNKPMIKALCTSALAVLQHKASNFTHPIHYAACTIDIFQRGKIYQLRGTAEVQKARAEMEALFIKYISQQTVSMEEVSTTTPKASVGMNLYLMDPSDVQEFNNTEIIDAAKIELSKYYRYLPSTFDIEQQDVLQFWQERCETSFPNLTKFANYILSIPASSNLIQKMFPEVTNRVSKDGGCLNASAVSDFLLYKSIKNLFGLS